MATRSRLQELLVVAGLTGFAFTQPVLSVLGENPTVFTRQRVTGTSMVIFVVVLVVVPPLLLWAPGALAGLWHRRAGRAVHLLTVGGLVGTFTVQTSKQAGLEPMAAVALLGLAAGLLFVAAYDAASVVTTWAAFTAPLPLLAMALFLLASPAGALAGPAPEAPARRAASGPPVVVIVLDELPTRSLLGPDGGLDATRFPELSAFAADATWYRHYTSVAPFTSLAVPAVLTGTSPRASQPTAVDHPDNLFTLLAPTHDLVVSESATSLCAMERCVDPAPRPEDAGVLGMLGTAVDVWQQRVSLGRRTADPLAQFAEEATSEAGFGEVLDGARARATPARLRGFIDSIDGTRPSTLYYHHAMLPHQPWITWPDGTTYREPAVPNSDLPSGDRDYRYSWNEWEAAISEQRHLLQVQHTDRLVGEVMDALRASDLYDDALIVVVGDHGVSFEPRTSSRSVTVETIDSIAYTPLLLKAPLQSEGRVDDANVNALDIVPTIAELLELDVPWAVDGAPMGSPEVAARGSTKTFHFFRGLFAPTLESVVGFDDDERFPSAADRRIGPLTDASDPASTLWQTLGVSELLQRPVDALDVVGTGSAVVHELDELVAPGPDGAPLGVVRGRVLDGPRRGRILLAVDGVVVSGSRIATDSAGEARFTFLLPPDSLRSSNEIALLVEAAEDGFVELVPDGG